jgi:hypothetical protein
MYPNIIWSSWLYCSNKKKSFWGTLVPQHYGALGGRLVRLVVEPGLHYSLSKWRRSLRLPPMTEHQSADTDSRYMRATKSGRTAVVLLMIACISTAAFINTTSRISWGSRSNCHTTSEIYDKNDKHLITGSLHMQYLHGWSVIGRFDSSL